MIRTFERDADALYFAIDDARAAARDDDAFGRWNEQLTLITRVHEVEREARLVVVCAVSRDRGEQMTKVASETAQSALLASNDSRLARARVNWAGMCWTTRSPCGKSDGSFGITCSRAAGPPVDTAMMTAGSCAKRALWASSSPEARSGRAWPTWFKVYTRPLPPQETVKKFAPSAPALPSIGQDGTRGAATPALGAARSCRRRRGRRVRPRRATRRSLPQRHRFADRASARCRRTIHRRVARDSVAAGT